MPKPPFEFELQFIEGIGSVDATRGVLRGVVVAEIGDAVGHFAYVDTAGKIVGVGGLAEAKDFPTAKRRLPLAMDEKSLETVITASLAAKRIKTREDHDDSIKSRAGFSQSFRKEGGRVLCDLNILDAYAQRAVFLETAAKTPELIGLSGDFKFSAEVIGDRAMMRVSKIEAVDIVDRGALTHGGLFRVGQVDIGDESKLSLMAKSKDDDTPDFAAFKTMCDSIAAYRAKNAEVSKTIDECMAVMMPAATIQTNILAAATEAKTDTPMTDAEKAALTTELTTSLTAVFTAKLNEALASAATAAKTEGEKAAKAELVEFKKQMSALGIKGGEAPGVTADSAAIKAKADADAAAAAAKGNNFFSLKASIAAERKVSAVQATQIIIREQPEVYSAHLRAIGVTKN